MWFSRDEEIEISNVKSCPTQDPNHTLFTVTMCMSTRVRRKQSVGTTCGCLRILMNKKSFKKEPITKIWRDKKLAGIHKVIEKNHIPTEPLNYGQTPPEHGRANAMTRTCDSTNRISQMRFAAQLALYQRPCIATNVPDDLPIQLLSIANPRPSFRTNQFHIDITKQKC